jgi:transposase
MLSDGQWALLEPLIEACRPKGKTPPQDLRRTLSAILWRHQNGAKWRAVPEELGPCGLPLLGDPGVMLMQGWSGRQRVSRHHDLGCGWPVAQG